jgi:hypothetical protein
MSTNIYFLAASVLSHLSCYFSNCPINGQCWKGREERAETSLTDDVRRRAEFAMNFVCSRINRESERSKQQKFWLVLGSWSFMGEE